MRPLLVILIWLLSLGIVQAYRVFDSHSRRHRDEAPSIEILEAEGKFAIEIGMTFEASPDGFTDEPSLEVLVNGKSVVSSQERIPAGRPLRYDDVEHIVVGLNEVLVKAGCDAETQLRARAIQVRVFRGSQRLAEHTMWAEPGNPLGGNFVIRVPAADRDDSPE